MFSGEILILKFDIYGNFEALKVVILSKDFMSALEGLWNHSKLEWKSREGVYKFSETYGGKFVNQTTPACPDIYIVLFVHCKV